MNPYILYMIMTLQANKTDEPSMGLSVVLGICLVVFLVGCVVYTVNRALAAYRRRKEWDKFMKDNLDDWVGF